MKIACTRCGANVVYIPSTGMCHCSHCQSDIPLEEFEDKPYQISYHECTCSSCGARLIVDADTVITDCVYCGSREFVIHQYTKELRCRGNYSFSY